jgi:hypothetical protein
MVRDAVLALVSAEEFDPIAVPETTVGDPRRSESRPELSG